MRRTPPGASGASHSGPSVFPLIYYHSKSDVPVVKSSKARGPRKPKARLPRPKPDKSRRERVPLPDPATVTYRLWLPEELEGDTDEE